MVRSNYLPSKNDLFFVSQIFYLNFVIITKNLSTGVYREIVAYTTTSDIGKMWQTERNMYNFHSFTKYGKRKPTNSYTFIVTPQYLKRVEAEK